MGESAIPHAGDFIFVEAQKMPGLLRFIFAQQHLTQKAAVANPGERPIASASSFQEIRLACFRAMIFSASNCLFIAIPPFGGNHAERTRQDFMRILIS
jgi:hypothetical protein